MLLDFKIMNKIDYFLSKKKTKKKQKEEDCFCPQNMNL
jgi:hypothetical protein